VNNLYARLLPGFSKPLLTIIRQNLELTVEERLLNLEKFVQFANELREAGKLLHTAGSIKK
jgi:hypothetical protein